MEFKQTFANLQAWAKKNPKTAGAIAIAVIVLAVIVVRRAASSGGGGSASEPAPASVDGGQIDLSGLGASMGDTPSMSGSLNMGGGGGAGASSGGGDSFTPSAPALDISSYDPGEFTSGGFSGDDGSFDATPAPAYASAAGPISTGDMLGLKTINATARAGIKGAAAKVQPAKTTTPANPGVKNIVATAGAGVGSSMYPPVLTQLKNTLSAGASKSPTPAPAKNLVASASAKIAPAKTTTPAKKTPTPAPALFAWYKTPWAPRVWLPVALAQSRGYLKVV